jgi:tRNA-Thr(GGU) m(6)t(6)A37 methyltransferase TsaA
MTDAVITYRPIGVIRSEHTVQEQTPIQPVYATGCRGRAEVLPELAEGLRDLDGFSHLYLIYHFHRAGAPKLTVKPYLQDVERGVFATRAPCRPNTIGLSVVELMRTPLLDIKPYTTKFDRVDVSRNGWHLEVDEETAQRRGRRGYWGIAPR